MKNRVACLTMIVAVIVAMIVAVSAHGATGSEKLIVVVPQAQITISDSPGSSQLKVHFNESEMVLVKRDGNYELRLRAPQNKDSLLAATAGLRVIEIVGPSLPVEIHLMEGQVALNQWKKEALIHIQRGKVIAKEGRAPLAIQVHKGEIMVSDHLGKLRIDSYSSNVQIKNLIGDLELDNFSGESVLEKAKGRMELRQTNGAAKVIQGSGNLQFELGRAILNSTNFAGRVEGQSQEGPVNINMALESEINVKTQTGRVTIHGVAGSSLNVHTQEGEIIGPSYLQIQKEGASKTLRGRLQGQSPGASNGIIYVRTQEGPIVLK